MRVTDPQNAGAGAREAVHGGAGEKAPVDGGRGTAQIAAQRQSSLWRTQRTDPQAYAESWHRRRKNQRGNGKKFYCKNHIFIPLNSLFKKFLK